MPAFAKEASISDAAATTLLSQLGGAPAPDGAHLIPEIYGDLRRVAAAYMRRERPDHTLQPTALVHEAYAQLADRDDAEWLDHTHFLATAATVMRHILVDHARAKRAGKRGGVQHQVTLDDALLSSADNVVDVLSVHQALERLTVLDSRQGRVVELHFFGGLTFPEIAEVLDISERTAKREWSMARAWLRLELAVTS
jgi:RNA polymerase sigma-70 factor, ECF subfamily